MKTLYAVLPIFILIVAETLLAGGQAPKPGKTVWNGIYTAEQAARGEQEYTANCSRCHGATLAGTEGNGLTGPDFMDRWREDSMGGLYEFVTESMPPARRGGGRPLIADSTYLDIMAFVLSKNDFPAGPNPLTSDGLDDILIQYKDGPRPLPNGALVRVTGCMTGSGETWSVTGANDPVRTRTSKTTDGQEFLASQSEKPGSQTFRLANLGLLGNAFKPDTHKGQKLMVKGNLINQTGAMRITVLAVRKVADTCE